MTIERNGLSGLALRIAMIAFAAIMFGCAPKMVSVTKTAAVAAPVEPS